MEPKFQSSFIPKQSLKSQASGAPAQERHRRRNTAAGLGTMLTFVFFIIMLGATGGLFLYNKILEDAVDQKIQSLERVREAFQPAFIKELVRLDRRMQAGKVILERHVATSNLFALLEQSTLRSVQLLGYEYAYDDEDQSSSITLRGQTASLPLLASQAQQLGINVFLANPVVSQLDADKETGLVEFTADAGVDDTLISFTETYSASTQNAANNSQ